MDHNNPHFTTLIRTTQFGKLKKSDALNIIFGQSFPHVLLAFKEIFCVVKHMLKINYTTCALINKGNQKA
jgi:hypothetical protein